MQVWHATIYQLAWSCMTILVEMTVELSEGFCSQAVAILHINWVPILTRTPQEEYSQGQYGLWQTRTQTNTQTKTHRLRHWHRQTHRQTHWHRQKQRHRQRHRERESILKEHIRRSTVKFNQDYDSYFSYFCHQQFSKSPPKSKLKGEEWKWLSEVEHDLTELSQGARSSSICGPPSANKQVGKVKSKSMNLTN